MCDDELISTATYWRNNQVPIKETAMTTEVVNRAADSGEERISLD
jgi:hypothetical protein